MQEISASASNGAPPCPQHPSGPPAADGFARPRPLVPPSPPFHPVQVILVQDVPGLGAEGALKSVPVGYWRNYLQPQGLAAFANAGILEQIKRQRAEEDRVRMEEKAKAQAGKV